MLLAQGLGCDFFFFGVCPMRERREANCGGQPSVSKQRSQRLQRMLHDAAPWTAVVEKVPLFGAFFCLGSMKAFPWQADPHGSHWVLQLSAQDGGLSAGCWRSGGHASTPGTCTRMHPGNDIR